MTKSVAKVGVGVLGASGYIGAEMMRYILLHPRLTLKWATANRDAGRRIGEVFPNLRGFVEQDFLHLKGIENRFDETQVVFLCLPHHESQQVLPDLAHANPGITFIDLAGDFRAPDLVGYRRYYGRDHKAPQLLDRFVYGFTEAQRHLLAGARLISNPGCFATGMLLILFPLAQSGFLDQPVCLTAITGSSGSGREPSPTTHHPQRAQNVKAYRPLVHQHLLEVECFLKSHSESDIQLQFVPQSGPIVRGIFTTVFLPGKDSSEVRELYQRAYGAEMLVDLVDGSPELRSVQSTPRSVVGVAGAPDRGTVVFSVIDNLGKGAASQAIQNLNCALGIPENEGLDWPGGFI